MDQLLLADLRQARQWAKLLAEDGRGRLSRELDATHISYCQTLMFPVIVDIIVVVIILGQTPREGQQKKTRRRCWNFCPFSSLSIPEWQWVRFGSD